MRLSEGTEEPAREWITHAKGLEFDPVLEYPTQGGFYGVLDRGRNSKHLGKYRAVE